jgi:2-desacetyl-2-hydroxyethyl bacteriochlorophyllide A dehydrogenase
MRAAWLERRALRVVADAPVPQPAPGEALVRVRRAGICGTDLGLARGYYPYAGVPGHEFVGQVEAAPAADAWIGRRVVGEINVVCHACDACRAGRPKHCERRGVLGILGRHGAFAQYLALPVENLHEVPPGVPDDAAVFVEPLAAALEVQQQVAIGPGMRVVVVGDGRLGQLVAQTLALTGCDLRVVGRHEGKLARLASLGIRSAAAADVAARGFDVAVECTGDPSGFELARRALRPRGTLVLKSTYAGELTLNASSLVVDEITLVGSRCGPFALALELLAGGRIDVSGLVHARYPLADAVAAFEHAARPGVLKVLLDCGA